VDQATIQGLALAAAVGGLGGVVAGLFSKGRNLFGLLLIGMIGGIVAAAMAKVAGADPIIDLGDGYSAIYALGGGFVFGFVVGFTAS
jgi:hypothetical protein